MNRILLDIDGEENRKLQKKEMIYAKALNRKKHSKLSLGIINRSITCRRHVILHLQKQVK
jgi:hypothetical protein